MTRSNCFLKMFPSPKKNLSKVAAVVLKLLGDHPAGLDIEAIRELGEIKGQQHLDKRIRELYPFYEISRERVGSRILYRLIREKNGEEYDSKAISQTLRARIIHRDGRRCRMCGRTVDDDNITLHIDHKIPREWGGLTAIENLWALCSSCNLGKRNYFASFDPDLMETVLHHRSVHRRLAEMLRAKLGEWVDCDLLEFVANFEDYQTDWRKRLRELRYLGLKIKTKNTKVGRRTVSNYLLDEWVELPQNPSEVAQRFESQRAKANKKRAAEE